MFIFFYSFMFYIFQNAVGFELWSMSQDILFDNIIITDEISVANKWAADTYDLKKMKIDRESVSYSLGAYESF